MYVDATNNYTLTTARQSVDEKSQFFIERPGYSLVGCYKNKINNQLEIYSGAHNHMSTEICFDACTNQAANTTVPFDYFGLTEGAQCFCGNTWNQEIAEITDCGRVCNGRDGDLCGGTMRTLVYKNDAKVLKSILVPPLPSSNTNITK